MTPCPEQGLNWLNDAEEEAVRTALTEVCASPAWAASVLARRPYDDAETLCAANDEAMANLATADLRAALAGHPPLGRPGAGDAAAAREQRGMAGAPDGLKAEMLRLNLRYQEKFGHVFLLCATGLTGEQMRDALVRRLENTPERELREARRELTRINRIRLIRLAHEGDDPR